MPVSESRKRASGKWDAKHLTIVGCRVRSEMAEEFKAACRAAGTTPNAVLLKTVKNYIGNAKEAQDES